MTQPDMTLSLADLLERHTRGADIPMFEGSYQNEEDEFIPDPRALDMVDFIRLAEINQAKIDQMQIDLHEQSLPKPPATQEPSKSGEADRPQMSDGLNEPQ